MSKTRYTIYCFCRSLEISQSIEFFFVYRVAKVKDISPPLDNSFSHCAHRGDGDTPDWGSVMSDERSESSKFVFEQIIYNVNSCEIFFLSDK